MTSLPATCVSLDKSQSLDKHHTQSHTHPTTPQLKRSMLGSWVWNIYWIFLPFLSQEQSFISSCKTRKSSAAAVVS